MIRDVLNYQDEVIGQLELPDDTPEEVWQFHLQRFRDSSVPVVEDPAVVLARIIDNAKKFGIQVIQQFTIENVAMGITQAGKTRALSLYCKDIMTFLQSGSLYAAIEEIDDMIADESQEKTDLNPFITNDRLNGYKTLIANYLGI